MIEYTNDAQIQYVHWRYSSSDIINSSFICYYIHLNKLTVACHITNTKRYTVLPHSEIHL